MMKKDKTNTTPSFVLTLPLDVDQDSQERLNADFFSFWRIYNGLVSISTKKWHQLRKTRRYKALSFAISKAKKGSPERKALYAQRNQLLKEAGFSRTGFDEIVKPLAKHFGVNSAIAQTVAERVWKAWNDFFFGKGKEVHYRRFDAFYSFRGKSNRFCSECPQLGRNRVSSDPLLPHTEKRKSCRRNEFHADSGRRQFLVLYPDRGKILRICGFAVYSETVKRENVTTRDQKIITFPA